MARKIKSMDIDEISYLAYKNKLTVSEAEEALRLLKGHPDWNSSNRRYIARAWRLLHKNIKVRSRTAFTPQDRERIRRQGINPKYS